MESHELLITSSGSGSLGVGGGRLTGLDSTCGDFISGSDAFSFGLGGSGMRLEGGRGRRGSTTGRLGAGGLSLEVEWGWGTVACSVAGIDDGTDDNCKSMQRAGREFWQILQFVSEG